MFNVWQSSRATWIQTCFQKCLIWCTIYCVWSSRATWTQNMLYKSKSLAIMAKHVLRMSCRIWAKVHKQPTSGNGSVKKNKMGRIKSQNITCLGTSLWFWHCNIRKSTLVYLCTLWAKQNSPVLADCRTPLWGRCGTSASELSDTPAAARWCTPDIWDREMCKYFKSDLKLEGCKYFKSES